MALMDLFKKKSPIEKALKDLREPYAQPEVRRGAMGALLEIGTPEAYDALMLRFTFNANGNIADEDEKRDLVKYIVDVGEDMIGPVKKFIETEKAVTFPIRALSQLVSKQGCVAFLVETLRGKEPLDHRSTDAKRALAIAIGDMGTPEDAMALLPYLEDHSDDVQITVVDALARLANPETATALAEVCCRDSHAARIQSRAAHVLMNAQWSVKAHWDRFRPEVKSEFLLGKKGVLTKKSRPADPE